MFGSALLQPARSVCISLIAFLVKFSFYIYIYIYIYNCATWCYLFKRWIKLCVKNIGVACRRKSPTEVIDYTKYSRSYATFTIRLQDNGHCKVISDV